MKLEPFPFKNAATECSTACSLIDANSMMKNLRPKHHALPSPSMYWDYYVIFKAKRLCL
jgi:hypothetical protein